MAKKGVVNQEVFYRTPVPPTRLPYRVHTTGRVSDQPYHATRGTYFNDAMFTLFLRGQGVYIQGNRRMRVSEGMVGLVLPSKDVGLLLANPDDPYDHYYCRFTGTEAMKTARRIVAEHGGEPFFPWKDRQRAVELLQRMCSAGEAKQNPDLERMRPIDGMVVELLALLDCPPQTITGEFTEANLRHYLQDHIAEAPDLQAVADYFGLSRCHVSRTAKQLLGEPLMDVWTRMKINWAQTLLRETLLPIAHVARRVGYQDPFYFSKVFRRQAGLTPRHWRSENSTLT